MLTKDFSFQYILDLFKVSNSSNNRFEKVSWQTHTLLLSVDQTVIFSRISCYGKTPKEWPIVYQKGLGS